ncbi:MAG TPA: DUF2723 domain-containing protein [Anaerolineae bacterium]|nr:DUF2723 domain-containing protein [Anaerolineae bacterium]
MVKDEGPTPAAVQRGQATKDESGVLIFLRSSSSVLRPLSFICIIGVLLGFFLARFWYELDPLRFAAFGEWPGVLALAAAAAIFLSAQWWFALRRLLAPDQIVPVHLPFALLLVYILWPEVDLRLAAILLLASAGLALGLAVRGRTSPSPPIPPSPSPNSRDRERGVAVRPRVMGGSLALALIVLAVYGRTLGTHVGRADTFEFQVVAPTLGVAHPTGYPLYILAGKLFSLLPLGSTAFRVNLTSAVFAAAATLLVYAMIARLSGRRLIAFSAALAFAFSSAVWSQAVIAEVYALNVLIAGLIVALLIDLVTTFVGGDSRRRLSASRDASYIVPALFLLLGVGLSHHLTTILLLPAFALAILIARPRLPLRTTLIALGLFVLGLLPWLYIPLRWPALHNGAGMTLTEFLDWITGARFGGALVLSAWSDPARWAIVGRFLLDAFGPAGLALAIIGVGSLALKHWRAALITVVAFAAYVFYGLVYFVPDVSVFLLPAHLVMALWIGLGVAALINLFTSRVHAPLGDRAYAIGLALFTLLPVFLIARNFALVDQRAKGAPAEDWGRAVLSLPLPVGAALLVDSEKIAPLYYLQVTEQLRPDLAILVLGAEQEYRQQLDTRLARGQAVYLARFLPNLPYHLRSRGPLVEVSDRPAMSNEPARQVFGGLIELVGWSVEEGDPARVTFDWRAITAARPNFHVRLRLIDAQGRVWWEDSGAHPVNGYYPTGVWTAGEVVADYHEIDFDPSFPLGAYTLQVGLFPPFRDAGLPTESGDVWWSVTQLIAPQVPAPPLDRTVRQVYGGTIGVSSVDAIGVTPQASMGQVRLNWARLKEIGDEEIEAALALVDAGGRSVWSDRVEPYGGSLRVKDWPPAVLQTALDFRTPDRAGVYTLQLSFVDPAGVPLPAKCSWLAPVAGRCPIGVAPVAGEAIGNAINFDNQVLLIGWSIDRSELRPGETINVRLDWRGLKTWDSDYTAFVHLVGPDGRLHGQVDAWPMQGTLPTSAWQAGQAVRDDVYAVTLPPDAPGGRYQIEVGWYLLATLRRLPVLDAEGRAIDDHVIVGEFSVP